MRASAVAFRPAKPIDNDVQKARSSPQPASVQVSELESFGSIKETKADALLGVARDFAVSHMIKIYRKNKE